VNNATHFKSKENLNFWSERPDQYAEWLKMVWVEFGCPDHGKGPWDGLGAMAKSKVTLDIMHGKERTSTGQITSPVRVAQHLRAIFCNKEWSMEHTDIKIMKISVTQCPNEKDLARFEIAASQVLKPRASRLNFYEGTIPVSEFVNFAERGKLGVESSQSRASAGSTCLSVAKVPPDYAVYIPPILGGHPETASRGEAFFS
jgi:hypothetical protein